MNEKGYGLQRIQKNNSKIKNHVILFPIENNILKKRKYPTPTATDSHHHSFSPSRLERKDSLPGEVMRNYIEDFGELPNSKDKNIGLNPEWVEWLMGYPKGWTDLDNNNYEKFEGWENDPSESGHTLKVTNITKNRAKRIKSLGNSVIPQIPDMIFKRINEFL